MKVALKLIAGPEAGKIFQFNEPDTFLVGRTKKAHLQFDLKADRLISRTHFLLVIRPPRCIITDLGSKNGTYLNGETVKQTEVNDGDEIRVGKTRIKVEIDWDWQEKQLSGAEPAVDDVEEQQPPIEPAAVEVAPPVCESEVEEKKEQLAETGTAETPYRFNCMMCGQDLTDSADSDGLALALSNSFYLCDSCTVKSKRPSSIPEHICGYKIISEIGKGGMGLVYKAVQEETRRICAVKMILPEMIRSEYASKVFEREIEIQSKVLHPNLVRVLDQGRHNNVPFFVTEFLPGGDVKNLVVWECQGPVEPSLACNISIQILAGLQALHDNGFIHRDLKPSNCLLDRKHDEDGLVVKIADYGLAKSFEDAGNSIFEYTKEGIAAGSYVFIPPEQITNYKFVKPPVDVYAVGASLYYMLTAKYSVDFPNQSAQDEQAPSAGKSRHPLQIVLEDPPVPILERKPDIPESLASVVDKAVTKEVELRFQSAREFRKELESVAVKEGWLQLSA